MYDALTELRRNAGSAADTVAQWSGPTLRGSQWYSRHGVSWTVLALGLVVVPALYLAGLVSIEFVNMMGRYLCFALIALSLDLLWGYTGMLCLCQAMFFAIGGYAMGMYLAHHGGPEGIIDANGWKIPACLYVVYPYQVGETPLDALVPWFWKPFYWFPAALALGLLIPAFVALVLGVFLFRSRVRGVFFAILTQAITLGAWLVFSMNNMKLCGTNGLTRFRYIAGLDLADASVKFGLYLVTVAALVAVYGLCRRLVNSRIGRVLIAIRDNESRLRFSGYMPHYFKIFIFTLSAAIAGLGGMLYVPQMGILTPADMDVNRSILVVIWVAVGGRGTLSGPILGALAVNLVYHRLTSFAPDSWPFVQGALFIAVVLLFPDGLMSLWRRWTSLPLSPSRGLAASPPACSEPRSDASCLERKKRDRLVAVFGLLTIAIGLYATWGLAWDGTGLMGRRSGSDVVVGLLLLCAALPAGLHVVGAIGLVLGRPWGARLAAGGMQWLLILLLCVIGWCFWIDQLSVGVKQWVVNGFTRAGMVCRENPAAVLAGLWAAMGLLLLHRPSLRRLHEDAANEEEPDATPVSTAVSAGAHSSAVAGAEDEQPEETAARSDRLREFLRPHRGKPAPRLSNGPLLRIENIKVLFDGFKALDIDEFSVGQVGLNVIIGPNGAGKTTLCDVISGKTPAAEGRVFFAGRNITGMSEVEIARLGVGRKFQTPTVFDSLTVYQNMELALPGRDWLSAIFRQRPDAEDDERINRLLKRIRLLNEAAKVARFLSHGQRQWLEIGMLILSNPRLLLVDEPAAGLTDEETRLTARLLLELQDTHSIIVIEHDMDFVRMLDAQVTVLNEGRVMARGTMQEIQDNQEVQEAYLGRDEAGDGVVELAV